MVGGRGWSDIQCTYQVSLIPKSFTHFLHVCLVNIKPQSDAKFISIINDKIVNLGPQNQVASQPKKGLKQRLTTQPGQIHECGGSGWPALWASMAAAGRRLRWPLPPQPPPNLPSKTPPSPSASTPGLLAPGVGHIHLAAFSLALAAGKHNNKV